MRSRRRHIRRSRSSLKRRWQSSAWTRKVSLATCWFRPSAIRNKEGRGLRVFTPFWRRVLSLGDPPKPLPAPKELRPAPQLTSDALESWKLEPTKPDWAGGLRQTWTPGEASARVRLRDFLKHTARVYVGDRDRPDREGTSSLSPHLRFGELSPRQVWHAARFAAAENPRSDPASKNS